jgi:hypothetical protein
METGTGGLLSLSLLEFLYRSPQSLVEREVRDRAQ